MRRTILLLSLFAWRSLGAPQNPPSATTDDVFKSTLIDLHGACESVDPLSVTVGVGSAGIRVSQPCLSSQAPKQLSTSLPPPSVVSAKHLLHAVPKAAMRALKKGEKLSRQNHPDLAAKELEQAIILDPEFAEAHGDLGVQYARLNRLRDAEAELRRALELDADDNLHHSNLGWVLFMQGRFEEAEVSVKRALRLAPASASAHLLFGQLLLNAPETRGDGLTHVEYAARTLPQAKAMLKTLR